MNETLPSVPVLPASATPPLRRPRPKWHLLYYWLAAFNLVTISASLYLTHQMRDAYEDSVRVNREWAARLKQYSELGDLAGALNAPGNDVFDTHDVTGESARLETALRRFTEAFGVGRAELAAQGQAGEGSQVLKELDDVVIAVDGMVGEARLIFSYFQQNLQAKAAERMATMDRKSAAINRELGDVRTAVGAIQQTHFEEQVALATTLRRFEFLIAGAILLIIGGMVAYGRKLSHKVTATLDENERHLAVIQASEERYHRLLDNAQDVVYTTDLAGQFTSFNTAAERVMGYPLEKILAMNIAELVAPECLELARANIRSKVAGGPATTYEVKIIAQDGRRVPLEVATTLIYQQGKPVGIQGIARDITARKQAESELLQAKEAAESATRAKSEFLASMSHEIRTPMNGVIGMLGLLQDGELSDRQREFAQIARSSADSLLVVLNDILDFSKIESGKMTIEPVTFDLQTMVEEVGELFATKVADKGLDLIVRYAPNMPRHVIGDAGRIRQVLSNLVGNAIKFTAQGHVLISLHCESQTNHRAQLKFSVEDTGIGIPEDKIARLFEKFMQADTSTTRRFGGTGLGLAISKQLTELMGGHMGVTSERGKGSAFWFTLPLELPTEALPAAPARTILAGVRVLIVDDNEVNRRVLHEQITSWRMRNGGYASGEEALTVLREARAAGDPFHIAVLDYQMPGMDGEMLARAIKADEVLRDTVLVMLTSLGRLDDTHQMQAAGIFACLVKPVRQSKLWDVLAQAWGAHTKQSPVQLLTRPQMSEPRQGEKKYRKYAARVLVADDNTTNQRVARLMLENLGCRVDVSANGREAVEMLELLPYDVVFMDCEMPEMDGYEATTEIRRRHAGQQHVPIVAMTAKAIQGDREHCLKAGMDDYISKPVRLEDLEATLERWFSKSDRDIQAVPEKTPVPVRPMPVSPALDPEVTGRLRQLAEATDPAVLTEIYDSFLSGTVEYLAALRQAEQAGDAERLRIAAHSLKGASANVGAPTVTEISRQLEALGSSQSVAGAAELIGQLAQAFEKVKIEIENQTREEALA